MDDPLSRALEETSEKNNEIPDIVHQHATRPREAHDLLRDVREQAMAALELPFFDGGKAEHNSPVVKSGVSEAGTVHISAVHRNPPYRADVTLYVRSDVESAQHRHYEVRARCEVSCDAQEPALKRDFPISVKIDEQGALTMDVAQLHAEIAEIIKSFVKASRGPRNG